MDSIEMNKIRWQCRRGSLELDLILTRFAEQKLADLNPAQQQIFKQLLEEDDTVLTGWIFGGQKPNREDFKQIISLIYKGES